MRLTVITLNLAKTGFSMSGSIVLEPKNVQGCILELRKHLTNNPEIIIYDITQNQHQSAGKIIPVNDHINKTGHNPLIGNQQKLDIDFTDLTHIYTKHPNGVTTACLGERFHSETILNKSAYFCNIAILARAIGFSKISGFLVNTQ